MDQTTTADAVEMGQALWHSDRLAATGLTRWIANLEATYVGVTPATVADRLPAAGVDQDLLAAALLVKRAAGQVNVLIHAVGIFLAGFALRPRGEGSVSEADGSAEVTRG